MYRPSLSIRTTLTKKLGWKDSPHVSEIKNPPSHNRLTKRHDFAMRLQGLI